MCGQAAVFTVMAQMNRRFIVVDDDRDVRYLVRCIVARSFPQATVVEAADGAEALRLFEEAGADLMIIDHDLPKLNGAELVRLLRARAVGIPLVIMSNFSAVGNIAMEVGATSFVDKREIHPCLGDHLPTLLAGEGEQVSSKR